MEVILGYLAFLLIIGYVDKKLLYNREHKK